MRARVWPGCTGGIRQVHDAKPEDCTDWSGWPVVVGKLNRPIECEPCALPAPDRAAMDATAVGEDVHGQVLAYE
jgi:hypothetical protein